MSSSEVPAWRLREGFFKDERLASLPFLFHAMSASAWGDAKDSGNLGQICGILGVDPGSLVRGKQVHDTQVQRVGWKDAGRIFEATDAFVTDEPEVTLAVYTADCQPVFFVDPKNKTVGLAHAGWRGIQAGIIPKTAQAMVEHFDTVLKDLVVAIGPHIRPCCYEVGDEVARAFPDHVREKPGRRPVLDLAQASVAQLKGLGVRSENISWAELCTRESRECFSYRRDPEHFGRMISVIGLWGK